MLRIVLLTAFGVVAPAVVCALLFDDIDAFLWLQSIFGGHLVTMWSVLAMLGSGVGMIAVLSPLWRWRPAIGPAIVLSTVTCGLVVQFLKHAVPMPRPLAVLGGEAVHVVGAPLFGHSFPSGHAAAAFACAAMLVASRLVRGKWIVAVLLAAAWVAFARVVIGAHWPSDVLAGAVVGWLSGIAGTMGANALPARVRFHLEWVAGVVLLGCGVALVFMDFGYPLALVYQRVMGVLCVVLVLSAWLGRMPAFARRQRT